MKKHIQLLISIIALSSVIIPLEARWRGYYYGGPGYYYGGPGYYYGRGYGRDVGIGVGVGVGAGLIGAAAASSERRHARRSREAEARENRRLRAENRRLRHRHHRQHSRYAEPVYESVPVREPIEQEYVVHEPEPKHTKVVEETTTRYPHHYYGPSRHVQKRKVVREETSDD